MKYKAIIFDMDGTIIDSNGAFEQAFDVLLERRGITCSDEVRYEIEEKTCGISLPYSCAIIKDILQFDDELDSLIQENRDIAHELIERDAGFITGFTDFHQKLKEIFTMPSAIATNADDHTLAVAQRKFKLNRYFGDHIYNISHVEDKYKPDPALYLHAAQQLNMDPKYCIAIEDSYHGVTAAKAAGMYCIGINTAQKPEALRNSDVIIDDYHAIDLTGILAGN